MDDRRIVVDLGFVETLGILLFIALAVGAFFLVRGVQNRDPIAIATVGGLVVISLTVFGIGSTLVIQAVTRRGERGREERERQRSQDNMLENLNIMKAMQTVQNQQNTMLLKQASQATHMLPAPTGETLDALAWDVEVFDELDG